MIDIIIAVVLDLIIGDPYTFPHPVKLMGKLIGWQERFVRTWANTRRKLKLAGFLIAASNILLGFFLPYLLLRLLLPYNLLYHILNIYLIYTCLAARSLHYEAKQVKKALSDNLEKGRKRLMYIVGRDTKLLNEEEIIKATVETVSENTSDGVIAPLLYIFILGAPAGLAYKFVNTMDSMLGYRSVKYRDLGFFPAIIDDVFNLIPARITALLMCLSSYGKYDVRQGFKILKRDKRNHKSPNAGYPESAVAGLLGIQLGGGNCYHGEFVDKPYIGDNINEISKSHIMDSVKIMYRSELFLLGIYIIIFI